MVSSKESLLQFFLNQPEKICHWKLVLGSEIKNAPVIAETFEDIHQTKKHATEYLEQTLALITTPNKYTLQAKEAKSDRNFATCVLVFPGEHIAKVSGMMQQPQILGITQEQLEKELQKQREQLEKDFQHKEDMRLLNEKLDNLSNAKKNELPLERIIGRLEQAGVVSMAKEYLKNIQQQKQQQTPINRVAGQVYNVAHQEPKQVGGKSEEEEEETNPMQDLMDAAIDNFNAVTQDETATMNLIADLAAYAVQNPTQAVIIQKTVKDARLKNGKL